MSTYSAETAKGGVSGSWCGGSHAASAAKHADERRIRAALYIVAPGTKSVIPRGHRVPARWGSEDAPDVTSGRCDDVRRTRGAGLRGRRETSFGGEERLLGRLVRRLHVQLPELLRVHVPGRAGHEVRALLRLRPGDDVAERLGDGEEHHEPVHAERDAAVRRRAELERVEEEAELRLRVLRRDPHRLEDAGLHLGVVEPDGAAADLEAVEHDVVAPAVDTARVALEVLEVLVARAREGVVRRGPVAGVLVVLEEGRVDDSEEPPLAAGTVLRDEPHLLSDVDAEVRHHGLDDRLLPELEEEQVARLRAGRLVDRLAELGGDRLRERRLRPLAALADLGAREPLRPHALHVLLELLDVRAREVRGRGDAHRLHDLLRLHGLG